LAQVEVRSYSKLQNSVNNQVEKIRETPTPKLLTAHFPTVLPTVKPLELECWL